MGLIHGQHRADTLSGVKVSKSVPNVKHSKRLA
ncbi:UNVERIFIED_CONTAM: hypothetical protein GTU68_021977 [Idotea baltica]|nr:hypothetical protein [Idotea baltica]